MWESVMFSDESWFFWEFHGRERVWVDVNCKDHEILRRHVKKHPDKVLIWSCFCASGVGNLYRVNGNLKSKQYQMILRDHAAPSMNRLLGMGGIFQQDNAPPHVSKTSRKFLSDTATQNGFQLIEWPPQSPDLSPIENLWAILDRRLKDRSVTSADEVFEFLQKAWDGLNRDQELLVNLIHSMPRRIQACIKNGGGKIKY